MEAEPLWFWRACKIPKSVAECIMLQRVMTKTTSQYTASYFLATLGKERSEAGIGRPAIP
eukprot:1181590-Karenia_brevis.AAC.1